MAGPSDLRKPTRRDASDASLGSRPEKGARRPIDCEEREPEPPNDYDTKGGEGGRGAAGAQPPPRTR